MFPALAALCLGVLVSCASPVSSSPPVVPVSPPVPTLAAYKFQAVAPRGPSDPQPYGTKVAVAAQRDQLYFDGLTYQGSTAPQHLGYDATGEQFTSLHKGIDSAWTTNPHATTAAHLGADGKQSVVSVVFTPDAAFSVGKNPGRVSLRVGNGVSTTVSNPAFEKGTEAFDLYLCGWGGNWNIQTNNEISVAAGDLTGDGRDEIGFSVGNRFVIVDGNLSRVLYDGWATGSGAADTDASTIHPTRVTAGDIKGDGTIAFVTATGSAKAAAIGTYKVYAGAPVTVTTGSLAGGTCPLSLLYANVALGDIDGDGRDEVLFAGRQDLVTNPCNVVAASWNPATSNLVFKDKGYTIPVAGGDWSYNPVPPLVAFHPNQRNATSPDQFDVVVAWDQVLTFDKTGTFAAGYKGLTQIPRPVYTHLIAGDVNDDNQEELVSFSSVGGVGLEVYSLGSGSAFTKKTIAVAPGTTMSLCTADLEGNSVVLEYLGSTVRYTNPQLVAVMASAPYYPEAATNPVFGNSNTSFGTGTATATEHSNSLTLKASFSIGADVDCPLWTMLGETKVKATVGASVSYRFSQSREISASQTFTVVAGNDAVIYTCIPFDVYQYRVLRPLTKTGDTSLLTVDFPRAPQLVMMERKAFNALPSNPITVGSSVLGHTLGAPFSYPTKAQVVGACANNNGVYDAAGAPIPVSPSLMSTSSVSVTTTSGNALGAGLSASASVETVVLGILFGAEVGFEDNYEYQVTATQSTAFSGTVSGLNTDSTSKQFQFGIAGYYWLEPKVQANKFLVVTYWVADPSLN